MNIPSPKMLTENWAMILRLFELKIQSALPAGVSAYAFELHTDFDMPKKAIAWDGQSMEVWIHPSSYADYQAAFVDADIIPVPKPSVLATIFAFLIYAEHLYAADMAAMNSDSGDLGKVH